MGDARTRFGGRDDPEPVDSAKGEKTADVGVGLKPIIMLVLLATEGLFSSACDALMLGKRDGIDMREGRGEDGPATTCCGRLSERA